jgi:hypothetical protein
LKQGVLTITGTGEMQENTSDHIYPWSGYAATVQSVVVGEGITTVALYAFKDCVHLESVSLTSSLTFIGWNAFAGDHSLKEINLPEGLQDISYYAFFDCSSLANVTIPSSVQTIREGAFMGTALQSITIPEAVTTIGYKALGYVGAYDFSGMFFMDELNDKFVIYGYTGTAAETYATECDLTFKSLDIDGSWGDNLSWNIKGTTLTISGTGAMAGLKETVDMEAVSNVQTASSESVVNLMMASAADDSSDTEFPWSDYQEIVTKLVVEKGVTTIAASAFQSFERLETVTLPDTMEEIGAYAFYDTGLTTITVPDSVTTIGEKALGYVEDETGAEKVAALKVKGSDNSAAATYAEKNRLTFAVAGDIDGNGTVDTNDLVCLMKMISADAKDAYLDVDEDGQVTTNDLIWLMKYLTIIKAEAN